MLKRLKVALPLLAGAVQEGRDEGGVLSFTCFYLVIVVLYFQKNRVELKINSIYLK